MLIVNRVIKHFLSISLLLLATSCAITNNSTPDLNAITPPSINKATPTVTRTNSLVPTQEVTQTPTISLVPQPSFSYPIIPGPVINRDNINQLKILGTIPEKTYQYSKVSGRVAYQLDWSPNSREIALASDGDGIRIIDTLIMKDIRGITEVNGEIINYPGNVVYSPDGKTLAITIPGGLENVPGDIIYLDYMTLAETFSRERIGHTIIINYSHNGKWMAYGTIGVTAIIDLMEGSALWYDGERNSFYDFVSFSWDDKYLAFRGDYGTRMVNTNTWSFVEEFDDIQSGGVICFSPDGKYLAQWTGIFSLDNFQKVANIRDDIKIDVCEFGKENDIVINYDSVDDKIEFWDIETGESITKIQGQGNSIYYMALSPDGRFLAIAKGDESGTENAVEIWGILAK